LLESTGGIISWHVPLATLEVINVLTPFWRFRSRLASAETELRIGHKIRPLVYLLDPSESRRENESANWIAIAVCTMRVEFTACIAFGDVEAR